MSNTNWRVKLLPVDEWAPLQDRFGELQMASGGPENLAMFCKSQPGQTQSEIYITGPGVAAIELFSPDGWQDSIAPSGEGVGLLVGAGNPWEFFGIEKPF